MAQNVAALFGHEDDTLLAWQRFCAHAAEALRAQHDPERLNKALVLAQGGHVAVEDDGFAVVTSGTKLYHVQADGSCDCPDYHNHRTPCKHVLAVLIHARAQELVAPNPSPAPPAAAASTPAPAPTPTKASRQARPRHSAAWDVHEAPVSSCFKIRVGAFEWTHTMRATDDAELHTRVQAFVPTFRAIVAALDALQAEREAAKAAPAVPGQPPAAPAAVPQADLQALLQQAVQQALAAAANGQAPGTPPAAPPSTGTAPSGAAPDDQQTGFCSLHQAAMTEHTDPASGDTWYSHYCDETQRYCKGSRPTRRNGRR
jgi:hypothetical protein